jgi:hypothetical protein
VALRSAHGAERDRLGPYWVLIAEPITDLDFELEAIRRADFTRMRNWVAATGDATVKIVRKVSD